ncbi:MAG: pyridoxal 5'-phosphate synthase glutaminase subunit PdxT [Desulfobacterales bacterium]|nr:pyridoxal 5'-phosphate synthase glutaminase subunit PdxT [Desulfobacterales bacterium]MCF8080353.1 pyridoxal 5'-phosphate synthase glutaminase subunit PdxT [Desulfobacterales bacterium]
MTSSASNQTVGLLGLQGAFQDHIPHLEALGARWRTVRDAAELEQVDRLIIPGGESTVMARYLKRFSLAEPLRARIEQGMPVWGVCAGSILLAKTVDGRPGILGALSIRILRNAYGRQVDSFQAVLDVPALSLSAFPAVFIRAPKIVEAGDRVEALSWFGKDPVFVRSRSVMATTFHPELGSDPIFHQYFLALPNRAPREFSAPGLPG